MSNLFFIILISVIVILVVLYAFIKYKANSGESPTLSYYGDDGGLWEKAKNACCAVLGRK